MRTGNSEKLRTFASAGHCTRAIFPTRYQELNVLRAIGGAGALDGIPTISLLDDRQTEMVQQERKNGTEV